MVIEDVDLKPPVAVSNNLASRAPGAVQ